MTGWSGPRRLVYVHQHIGMTVSIPSAPICILSPALDDTPWMCMHCQALEADKRKTSDAAAAASASLQEQSGLLIALQSSRDEADSKLKTAKVGPGV